MPPNEVAVLPGGHRDTSYRSRLLVIGSLYLVANIGYSFFFLTLATILLGRGVPLGTVALINLLGGIYFARFLVAPVVDRFGSPRFGHYRGWLLLTQLALVGTLIGLAPLDPVGQLPVVLVLTCVVLVLSVFHDTALSGLAVRLLRPCDRGMANGVQIASASVSMLIGSGGALLVYAHAGWTVTLLALAVVFVIPLAVVGHLTEPPAPREAKGSAPWSALTSFFRRPRMAVWTLLVLPLFAVGEWLANSVQSPMLLSAGWSMDRIALVQGLAAGAQVVAALVTGAAVNRYGRWRPAAVVGLLGVAAVTALLPLSAGRADLVPTVAALSTLYVVYGAKLTVVATVSMDMARQSSAATDYSVPMSVEGLFVTAVGSIGLGLSGVVGFPWLIRAAILLALTGTAVGPAWLRRHADPTPDGPRLPHRHRDPSEAP